MGAKSGQGRAKLTPPGKRQGKRLRGVESSYVDVTKLTPKSVTRKYKLRARKCANRECQKMFTPEAKHGRFCSDACRQFEARKRKKKGVKMLPVVRDLELTTCLYCGNTFLPETGRGAKFCSDSHKELAYRQRREATINAVSEATGMSLEDAAKLVKSAGMPNCTRWLHQQGLTYNDTLRRWLMSMAVAVSV